MKQDKLKNKSFNYIPLGFLVPFLAMLILMIIGEVLPFGTKSLLYSDAYHQYYPFFVEFRRALLSGDSLLYSWNVGMGVDYLGLIAYYLASPLNLLSIFIPENFLLYYFTYLTPIRLGLAGLFFSIFLNKMFGKNDISVPLFGSFYALCAWSLGYQWNVMWLDTFLLLPLVALGTYKLLKEKKFILYTTTLFLSIFSNYYVGFFTCIFVLLIFICYQICEWSGFKKFGLDLLRIAAFSIIAISMTAILELPAFAALQTTHSSVNQFPQKFSLNIVDAKDYKDLIYSNWDQAKALWNDGSILQAISYASKSFYNAFLALLDGMKQVAGNTTGATYINHKDSDALPNIYCGVFTLIFSILFLTCKQIKVREKICSVFLLIFLSLSFLIRQLDYMWHGFHFTNMIPYRFSFIYSFVMLYMGYRAYILRKHFEPWQIIIATLLSSVPVLLSNDMSEVWEVLSSADYWNSFRSALSSAHINGILDNCSELFYPVYNFLIILATTIVLLIGSLRRKYPAEKSVDERKAYIKQFRKRQRISSVLLCCVIGLELILNIINGINYWSGASISDYPKGQENAAKMFEKMRSREDDLFYRAETAHSQILNDAALNDYNGITTFTSSANVGITNFMRSLGYGALDSYNRYCYESGSPVSDLFLNIKYVVDRDGLYYEGDMIRKNSKTEEKYTSIKPGYTNPYYDVIDQASVCALTENNAYLPLGFLCEDSLAQFHFENNSKPFEFDNLLIEAATGNSYNLWHHIDNDLLSIQGDSDVSITTSDQFGKCRYKAEGSGIVTYAFTADREGLFCFRIDQGKRNDYSVWLNNNHDDYPDERVYSESYSLPQTLSVCNVVPGDVVEIQVKCSSGDSARIEIYGAILDEAAFRDAHSILAKSTLNVTRFSNTRIEGTINCDRDGLLYTSVPQNGENWKVFVDGKAADITLVGDVMIGIYLDEGNHSITFQYENKAFNYGCIITIVSTAIFIALWIICYKPYKSWKEYFEHLKSVNIITLFQPKNRSE